MSDQPTMQEYIHSAQEILSNLLRLSDFGDVQVETTVADGQIFFQLVSEDTGRLIGRTSQTLDALQFPQPPAVTAI